MTEAWAWAIIQGALGFFAGVLAMALTEEGRFRMRAGDCCTGDDHGFVGDGLLGDERVRAGDCCIGDDHGLAGECCIDDEQNTATDQSNGDERISGSLIERADDILL